MSNNQPTLFDTGEYVVAPPDHLWQDPPEPVDIAPLVSRLEHLTLLSARQQRTISIMQWLLLLTVLFAFAALAANFI